MASTFVAAFEILSFGAIIVLVVLGLGTVAYLAVMWLHESLIGVAAI